MYRKAAIGGVAAVDPSRSENPASWPGDGKGTPERSTGLVRDRLTSRLVDPGIFRIGWLVAPAGSGKSRLLAHVAHGYVGPVAWCGSPDPPPRTESALVAWLWPAINQAAGHAGNGDQPQTVSELVGVHRGGGAPILVVLDDVHLLEGTEAEVALGELIVRLPDEWRLAMASRVNLGFDLSRMRVSGEVVDIGPDDLRFRTWEVEELFRDVYGEPLLPEDVAVLARRTSGWAAYLQLFFLATSRKPLGERRSVLGSLQNRTRLVSEYLGRHVLAGLAPELQDFLIRTSVLRRPTPDLCDEFLGRTGSADLLAELERRQLFTERVDDRTYRYHAVLLSYLDAKLVETIGLAATNEEHHRAARLLEREGRTEEALVAYARAEDWEGVANVLGHAGPGTDVFDEAWIDALPPAVLESDPLLLLVRAHQALARGSLTEAVHTLRRAESVSVSMVVADRCRQEREQIQIWMDAARPVRSDWVGLIRAATQRQPLQVQRLAASLPGVTGRFAEGCAAFLAGDLGTCLRLMRGAAQNPDAPPALTAGAALLGAVARSAAGRPPSRDERARILEEIDTSGIRWLNRMARAALVLDHESDEAMTDLVDACERQGDRWGAALTLALSGIAKLAVGSTGADRSFELAARIFGELGAAVLEATCLAHAALLFAINGRADEARSNAAKARALAALNEAPGPAGLSMLVLALISGDPDDASNARNVLEGLGSWAWYAELAGLSDDSRATTITASEAGKPEPTPSEADSSAVAVLKCLGAYALTLGGQAVDDASAKPMERALLHLLSARAGEVIHREDLMAALWPDAEGDAGLHRLQTAVSALRRLLSRSGVDGNALLVRNGDGYGLVLPSGSDSDVANFERATQRAAAARARGDSYEEEQALVEAMDMYAGPLLPSDGPAEWAVVPRRRLEGVYTDVASRLAALRLERDAPIEAVQAARAGLEVDRYRDDLWKTLITACERAGNHVDAERARQNYEAILQELGV